MTQLDMGKDLKDKMLSQTREGREERIRLVREHLERARQIESHISDVMGYNVERPTLTADDVWEAANALGFTDGDTRWTGNVLKGWALVEPTDRFVPSRRKERHCAPVRVWRWR